MNKSIKTRMAYRQKLIDNNIFEMNKISKKFTQMTKKYKDLYAANLKHKKIIERIKYGTRYE